MFKEILLTALTIATGVLSVQTFFLNRKKDSQKQGETDGELHSDIKYIKDILIELRNETKEINRMISAHSIDIAKAQESLKSAHKRIDEAFARIEALENQRSE